MRRTLVTTIAVGVMLALPLAASAQEEPYSSSTVPATTVTPEVDSTGTGLTATFTVSGVTEDCTWDFGDDTTGAGNPVEHTYSAAGSYDVEATCGTEVLGIVFVASDEGLATTGFDSATLAGIALVVLLLGGAIVAVTRRTREN